MVAEAHADREMAKLLFVTVGTVETRRSHAHSKLGVRSHDQLGSALSA